MNISSHPHRFFHRFVRSPRAVGAVLPASPSLSRAVAQATREAMAASRELAGSTACDVLELGAGTGALTEGIVDLRPVLVERDAGFCALLGKRFPQLELRAQCATEALGALRSPVGIVSSIPMLNNPESAQLKEALAQCHAGSLIRFLVLYTYGAFNPLRGMPFALAQRSELVWQSIPPASVWVYR